MTTTIQRWTCNNLPKECYIAYDNCLSDSVFKHIELPILRELVVNAPDSPIKRKFSDLLANQEYDKLSLQKVDPSSYQQEDLLRWDLQLVSLLKKSLFVPTIGCPENRARVESAYCEMKDRESNQRLMLLHKAPLKIQNIFHRASVIISKTLGTFNKEEWFKSCRYGPGTSSSCRKEDIHIYGKMTSRLDVTDEAYEMFHELVITRPELFEEKFSINCHFLSTSFCEGGTVRFVDKTAQVKRQIVIEPHCNMLLQLGLGSMISRKLASVGLDKPKQALRNKLTARQASQDQKLVTWDLRSGSSLICKMIPELVVRSDWFNALNAVRSHYIIDPGSCDTKPLLLEKFSEMGNGFTFELETLIFWAFLKASCEYDGISSSECMVFGDDLIFPSQACQTIAQVFKFCGFEVNQSKSFSSGPFRESCGGDYFNGNNVRPFFLRKDVYDNANLISIANGIRRAAMRTSYNADDPSELIPRGAFCDKRFFDAWLFVFTLLYDSCTDIPIGCYTDGDSALWVADSETFSELDNSISVHRIEPRINMANYGKAGYILALNRKFEYSFIDGKQPVFITTPGSLPLVRRPDSRMGSEYRSRSYTTRPDAPPWR